MRRFATCPDRRARSGRVPAIVAAVVVVGATAAACPAVSVPLQNAQASFEQGPSAPFPNGFQAAHAIDGFYSRQSPGWAIHPQIWDQYATFEAASPFVGGGLTELEFTLEQLFNDPPYPVYHTIGRFRVSVTGDAGPFDGGTSWSVLSPTGFASASGDAGVVLADGSILVSDATAPVTDVYTVTAETTLTSLTGFRLEVLEDASLPYAGPGRQPTNGNFVLTGFAVEATALPPPGIIPEPLTALGMFLGLGGLAGFLRRRQVG